MALRTKKQMRGSRGDLEGKIKEEIAKVATSCTPAANTVTAAKLVYYQSSEQTGVGSTPIALTHGLGGTPTLVIPSITSVDGTNHATLTYTATSTVINVTPVGGCKFIVTAVK